MPGHRVKITDDIKKYLLNHTRLQEWGGFTLAQRC